MALVDDSLAVLGDEEEVWLYRGRQAARQDDVAGCAGDLAQVPVAHEQLQKEPKVPNGLLVSPTRRWRHVQSSPQHLVTPAVVRKAAVVLVRPVALVRKGIGGESGVSGEGHGGITYHPSPVFTACKLMEPAAPAKYPEPGPALAKCIIPCTIYNAVAVQVAQLEVAGERPHPSGPLLPGQSGRDSLLMIEEGLGFSPSESPA